MNKKKILITGGNGFIGHHFCEHILKNTDWDIDIVDRLSYASMGYSRLKDVNVYDDRRVRHFCFDFTHKIEEHLLYELQDCDFIIHMGAETHVDNSIKNPEPFVLSNVVGTMRILELARKCTKLEKMIYFSTDEVFGPAPEGTAYKEWDRYNSTNPYSASKAGGEELCLAYANCYKVPVMITHTMNVFGERQHSEKFIPKVIKKVLSNEVVYIHSDPTKTKPGTRFWIHARNAADATLFLLNNGKVRDKYNIVGEKEVNVLEMAQFIAKVLGRPLRYEMQNYHESRPGHDLRYALDGTKLAEMGYVYPKTFEQSLEKTIKWSLMPDNIRWLTIS